MNEGRRIENYKYPTKQQLKKIERWDKNDTKGLISYIQNLWWAPDWGFRLKEGKTHRHLYKIPIKTRFFRKKCLKLELHTGGWSGNELIIDALKKTTFWMLYWTMSRRGGHYYFEIEI